MKKKKVGILTFYNAMNYGAILQCYALQTEIESMGCDVEVVDYTPEYFNKVFFDPMKPFNAIGLKNKIKSFAKLILKFNQQKKASSKQGELRRFISQNLKVGKTIGDGAGIYYDVIVAGSDQIWNLELLENDITYLLDFDGDYKRVSYAASFKISDIDDFAMQAYKKYLSRFDNISVRENNLKEFLSGHLNINSDCVLDPTFLLNEEDWSSLVKKDRLINNNYLLIYHVNQPVELINMAFEYAKLNNLEVVSLNTLDVREKYVDYSNASIEEFLNLIKYANTIFTTSFHGMAFSINFHKNFYFEVPNNSYNNNQRLIDLADKLGLQDRNISNGLVTPEIDWMVINNKLDSLVKKSKEYLANALGIIESI